MSSARSKGGVLKGCLMRLDERPYAGLNPEAPVEDDVILAPGFFSVRASANRHAGSLWARIIDSARAGGVDEDQALLKCKTGVRTDAPARC
jgi:hypothetical protein